MNAGSTCVSTPQFIACSMLLAVACVVCLLLRSASCVAFLPLKLLGISSKPNTLDAIASLDASSSMYSSSLQAWLLLFVIVVV
jgi:hypothetical protein